MHLRLLLTWTALALLTALPLTGHALRAAESGEGERADPLDAAEEAVLRSVLDVQERQARARNYVARGREMMAAERYAEALEAFDAAIRFDPDNAEAREGRLNARRYIEARSEDLGAVIPREIERVRVGEQQTYVEAMNYIQTAEARLAEVAAEAPADLQSRGTAEMLVARLRLLAEAEENLRRADLALSSLPARLDPESERRRVAVLMARVRDLQQDLNERRRQAESQIALEERRRAQEQTALYGQRQKEELMRRARAFHDVYEFDKAETIVGQILQQFPNDQEAENLLQDIQRQRRQRRDRIINQTADEERRRVLLKIERSSIPEVSPERVMSYPENWDILLRSKESATSRAAVSEDELSRRTRQKLQERHTVEFEEQDVRDVVDHLRSISGINMIYNPEGGSPPPVTLRVREMSLSNILQWIMQVTGLNYEIRDGAVYITLAEALESGLVTEVYDVRDLMRVVRDARPMPAAEGEEFDDEEDDDEVDLEPIQLDEVIRTVLAEEFGDGAEGEVLLDQGGSLTVKATRPVHRNVEELLAKLRAANAIQVSISARFLTITDDFWEQFTSRLYGPNDGYFDNFLTGAADESRNPADPNFVMGEHFDYMRGRLQNRQIGGLQSVLGGNLGNAVSPTAGLQAFIEQTGWLGQIQANWMIRAIKESQKADELYNPHIIVYNNRYGWFRQVERRPFIHGYVLAPAGVDLEAVIEELQLGSSIQVRPIVSADKKYITLDVYPRVRNLMNMGVVNTTGALTGHNLPIDLPTVFEHNARTFATLPDGGAILLSGMAINVHMRGRYGVPLIQDIPLVGNIFSDRAYQQEKRNFVIMVNARMLLLDEEEARQTR